MPNPATFEPLVVTGYEVEFDPRKASDFTNAAEGETFEHARISLPNGYAVSVARTNVGGGEVPQSVGYDEGRWEAALMKPQTDPIFRLLVGPYQKATELDHLTTHEVEDWKVVGNLDNAGIQELCATVAALPAPTENEPESTLTDEQLFAEFFGPVQGEEEGA